jgi:hypothetical protein
VLRIFIAVKYSSPSTRFEASNLKSNGKHANHYTTEENTGLIYFTLTNLFLLNIVSVHILCNVENICFNSVVKTSLFSHLFGNIQFDLCNYKYWVFASITYSEPRNIL